MSLPKPPFDTTPFDVDEEPDSKAAVAAELAEVWAIVEELVATSEGRKLLRKAAADYQGHSE